MCRTLLFLSLVLSALTFTAAFAPATQRTFQPARLIHGSASYKQRILYMSEEKKEESTEVAPKASDQPQGTFYDDEVRRTKSCFCSLLCYPKN